MRFSLFSIGFNLASSFTSKSYEIANRSSFANAILDTLQIFETIYYLRLFKYITY